MSEPTVRTIPWIALVDSVDPGRYGPENVYKFSLERKFISFDEAVTDGSGSDSEFPFEFGVDTFA